jgi:hypothetical protein
MGGRLDSKVSPKREWGEGGKGGRKGGDHHRLTPTSRPDAGMHNVNAHSAIGSQLLSKIGQGDTVAWKSQWLGSV